MKAALNAVIKLKNKDIKGADLKLVLKDFKVTKTKVTFKIQSKNYTKLIAKAGEKVVFRRKDDDGNLIIYNTKIDGTGLGVTIQKNSSVYIVTVLEIGYLDNKGKETTNITANICYRATLTIGTHTYKVWVEAYKVHKK